MRYLITSDNFENKSLTDLVVYLDFSHGVYDILLEKTGFEDKNSPPRRIRESLAYLHKTSDWCLLDLVYNVVCAIACTWGNGLVLIVKFTRNQPILSRDMHKNYLINIREKLVARLGKQTPKERMLVRTAIISFSIFNF